MRLAPITAALAVALLAAQPGVAGTSQRELAARQLHPSCTPELQRCLQKLERRLLLHDSVHDWTQIPYALLKLGETDPECALLLEGTGWRGL